MVQIANMIFFYGCKDAFCNLFLYRVFGEEDFMFMQEKKDLLDLFSYRDLRNGHNLAF